MPSRLRLAILASAVMLTAASLIHAAPPAEMPPIAGVWTFNAERSIIPDNLTRTRIEGPLAGAGGGFTGEGRPDLDKRRRADAVVRRLKEAPPRLAIVSDGSLLTFQDGPHRSWSVTVGGKKTLRLTGDGEIETKAWVEDGQLMIEEDLNGPTTILYAYTTVEEEGVTRLEVTVSAKGRGGARPIEIRRIYDPARQPVG